MNIVSIDTRERLLKTFTILTAVATVLALSGVAYLAPTAFGAVPSDYGLTEGDTISAAGSDDPDVYIVNDHGYKRLFLNPAIFGLYGHLGGFAAVKNVSPATRDAFPTSGLFRVDGDEKVYGLETTGEDVANLRWVNTSGAQAVADDPNFFKKVFIINAAEKALYGTGPDFTSVTQVPVYVRGGSEPAPTPTPSGPLSVSVAPGNPGAQTLTKNAAAAEYLKVRFSGTGTINTLTLKRLGAGATADFTNVYVYDGATRLVDGKTFSSSTGEMTFLVDVPVNGTKDLTVVAQMAGSSATAGNVNYIQLKEVTLSGGSSVSGLPVNGNNMTISGASSGVVTIAKSGVINNPTVGQKQAKVSEFKLTTATEGGTLTRLTMLNGGTVDASSLTNVMLKTGTSEWSGTVTADNYFVFDLNPGHFIAKGGNSIFKVYVDVGGKKDETLDLYFEYDTDTHMVGDQFNQPMAVTDDAMDAASDITDLTLQGGVLTIAFNGPDAKTIPTTVTDTTMLRYSMTAASNVEIRKTRLVLCSDPGNDGTYNDAEDETVWDDVTDVKIWDEDLSVVIAGPKDGTDFATDNTVSCPDAAKGSEVAYTDTYDLLAGKTYNFKVTADVDTSLAGTTIDTDSVWKIVLRDQSANVGVTEMKYSGTNTALAAADIIPRADLAGNDVTIAASSLTLSLAGSPASQTKVKGTKDVDVVGITFSANQGSSLLVNQVKLTGYAAEASGGTYDEGVAPAPDTGISVANAMSNVELWDSISGAMVGGSGNVTNNSLSVSGTGTITFSDLSWNIPSGTSRTLLVRTDLSGNAVSGTNDVYSFDIAATGDVSATDDDSNTINAGNAAVNGGLSPTKVLTVAGSGAMTLATSADSPAKGAVYWGQTNAPISKFRLSATDEGQYIEKLTFAASVSTEKTDAAANVKNVHLTYKNKAGDTLTTSQAFGNAASVNFAWASGDANRPYVPQDGSMDVAVNADMKVKSEGATQDSSTAVFFSLDLVDKFNGSHTDGFRAVGDGSGTVLSGSSTNIDDVLGANDQYVYRVFPKIEQVALASPYSLTGTPTVFKFSITAMGLAGSTLRFDNEATPGSGSLKFEIVSSGTDGGDSNVTTYDENNTIIDTVALSDDGSLSPNASYTMDFTSVDVEIAAGNTKTFRIQLDSTTQYQGVAGTGVGADYFQVTLLDNEASLINWVGDYAGANTALDTASTTGVLKSLPLYGPTFVR